MVNTRIGCGIDLPGTDRRSSNPQMEHQTPEPRGQGEDSTGTIPTPQTDRRMDGGEPSMMNHGDTEGGITPQHQSELDKQLELARLQLQIAELQKGSQPSQENKEKDNDFIAYTRRRVDPKSEVGRYIMAFHETTKSIRRPTTLTGTPAYLSWQEGILLAARQADINHIIEERQLEPPSADERVVKLWHAQNAWLYGFMQSSISTEAQSHYKAPDNLSAYALWEILETTFAERPQAIRKCLYHELICLNTKTLGTDRNLIERILAIRTELDRLGYPLPEWVLFDIAQMQLSPQWKEFMQTRLDQADRGSLKPPEEDFVTLMKDILTRLPAGGEPKEKPQLEAATTAHTQDSRNSSRGRVRNPCSYCEDTRHEIDTCWYKHPSQSTERWRQRNASQIDALQKKHEGIKINTFAETNNREQSLPVIDQVYSCWETGYKRTCRPHTCRVCKKRHFGTCWIVNPSQAPKWWQKRNTQRDGKKLRDTQINNCTELPYSRRKTTNQALWIMDSGGGSHATGETSSLRGQTAASSKALRMANGSRSLIRGTGRVDLPVNGGALTLNKTRLVEGLRTGIISFGLLVRQGYTFKQLKSNEHHSILWTSPDQTVSFETPLREDNIYILEPSRNDQLSRQQQAPIKHLRNP